MDLTALPPHTLLQLTIACARHVFRAWTRAAECACSPALADEPRLRLVAQREATHALTVFLDLADLIDALAKRIPDAPPKTCTLHTFRTRSWTWFHAAEMRRSRVQDKKATPQA